ncbi:sure-like protein [Laetiporus sulphureus 93-53]|uniref:Sure-like protein n=1 Tax=Laetiporus sulphureus 93-53 TaxID=1314785 RepID=A0A165CG13_9APHY|nr:sure-like protein [Laetiporus sulphureus 93-53]KZT02745.1 sure-like protein [Laetiporus sulphureus 93-53]
MSGAPLRVLLTNDDGPPGPDSPYIYGLYRHLTRDLGWDVRVVIPSSQKSWIGKAYQIKDIISGRYYYPRDPDGLGEVSDTSRPLQDGEVAEWILFDGTPATCANIALHNLYHGDIDLLISGPNLGRNSSAAFTLSSGTIGAAMSSSLSRIRSIALSYGIVHHPTPASYHDPAHRLGAKIISHLWDNWGADEGGLRNGEVDLYNVNIPMIEGLLSEEGLRICWTRIWRNSYGRLFKAHTSHEAAAAAIATISPAGPDAPSEDRRDSKANVMDKTANSNGVEKLLFRWAPDMTGLINSPTSSMPVGSDGWAISQGWSAADAEEKVWRLKL